MGGEGGWGKRMGEVRKSGWGKVGEKKRVRVGEEKWWWENGDDCIQTTIKILKDFKKWIGNPSGIQVLDPDTGFYSHKSKLCLQIEPPRFLW